MKIIKFILGIVAGILTALIVGAVVLHFTGIVTFGI